jgi:hypothetical protein
MTDPSEPTGRDPEAASKPYEPMPSAPPVSEEELAPLPPAPVDRPKSVDTAFLAWMIGVGISVISLIFIFTVDADAIRDAMREGLDGQNRSYTQEELDNAITLFRTVTVVFGLILIGLFVLFAYKMRAGRNWARITLTVLGGLSIVLTISGLGSTSGIHLIASIAQLGTVLAAVWYMFRPDANQYFASRRPRRY